MAGKPETQIRPISNIVIVVAMEMEALPIVNRFRLTRQPHSSFPERVPWVRYGGTYKDLSINLIWPGKDPASAIGHCFVLSATSPDPFLSGADSIGTIPSALVTYAAIQALQPDLIINAGTTGGFKAKGASIGDIFIISGCAFHDRRIPIPGFDLYGVGLRKAFDTPNLIKELNLKGAAIAYVADLLKVPAIFVKAVTNIVDGDKPIVEEFLENLAAVADALDPAVEQVVNFINGNSLSEL
ncbi:hypothetical protein PHAVU_009G000700 [Phaseolus vulgaris]|uniref:5'-methylthioadenosine nucleosidase-like isoform X5 n=1 Tax=Phaseolus vulgaris TaxID=3885 RepID=UPI0035C9E050